jgi:carboxyl-terminal processing protease
MSTFKRTFLITFFSGLLLMAAFASGYLARAYQESTAETFPLLDEAYSLLRDYAYNPLPKSSVLQYGMIRGMLQAYGDPHTSFLEPPQAELESNSLQGSFGGIGVRLGADGQGNYVLYPFVDSPAAQAGILEGDRLLGVDRLEVTPQTPSDTIQAAIRGPVGQAVTLRVGRPPDFAALEFSIKRAEIALPSVTWHLEPSDPRLGIVEVNVIAATTPEEIKKAAADLQSRGAAALALDLRNNGGGLLDRGVEAARLFLKDGVVIYEQYRGKDVTTNPVEKPGPLADVPLVVFVNQYTASASEIIAGSLQTLGRAKLIGVNTYGKDTIQLVFELRDHSSLHVTTARWWFPGRVDQPLTGRGLAPDIPVTPDSQSPDPYITAAIQTLFP